MYKTIILLCLPWHLYADSSVSDSDSLLIAAYSSLARLSIPAAKLEPFSFSSLLGFQSADFDIKSNCLFWTTSAEQEIRRKCSSGGSNDTSEVTLTKLDNELTRIAYDWTSGLLYFTDPASRSIQVIGTTDKTRSFKQTIIYDPEDYTPLHLAVHPRRGYLFWTSQNEYNIRIYRSSLDGTDMKLLHAFTSSTGFFYAISYITIDYELERIVWSDVNGGSIIHSDFDGGDIKFFRGIKANMLAVIDNHIYWYDDHAKTFHRMQFKERDAATNATRFTEKFEIEQLDVLSNQRNNDIRLISRKVQSITNACNDNERSQVCSHVCMGLPNNEFVCHCPNEMFSAGKYPGKCFCHGGRQQLPDGKCPELKYNCERNEFECSNHECVPNYLACDGEMDCSDGADELNCSPCLPFSHQCESDGRCLSE